MTKALFKYDNSLCSFIELSGHAGYAKSGSDIVCSGITTALYTSINLIDKINHDCFTMSVNEKSGFVHIDFNFLNLNDDDVRIIHLVIKNLIDMLEEIKQSYSKYLKIEIL